MRGSFHSKNKDPATDDGNALTGNDECIRTAHITIDAVVQINSQLQVTPQVAEELINDYPALLHIADSLLKYQRHPPARAEEEIFYL